MTVNSPLASPRATIDKLLAWGINTQKSLGQHFLIDDGVVGRILRLAALDKNAIVLEVGPGIGTLTEALLLDGISVIAIEKDKNLLPILADLKVRNPEHFELIHGDALDIIPTFAEQLSSGQRASRLVANLPYSVAATVILDVFIHLLSIESATVMVQKEVAQRMTARPGTKDYGAYTVKLAQYASPRASFDVNRSCFLPPPRVDSTVIRLDRCPTQMESHEAADVFFIIEAAFAERRKTIRNSMCSYFSQHALDSLLVDTLLNQAGITPTDRGETLDPEDFLHLGRLLRMYKESPL